MEDLENRKWYCVRCSAFVEYGKPCWECGRLPRQSPMPAPIGGVTEPDRRQLAFGLRSALTEIMGYARLLHAEIASDLTEQQSNYMTGLLEGAARVLDIVNDLRAGSSAAIEPLRLDTEERGVAALSNRQDGRTDAAQSA